MKKIGIPTKTPSVVLNSGGKNKKRKNIPKIVATFVYASSQGQRTHSARTNLGSPDPHATNQPKYIGFDTIVNLTSICGLLQGITL